MGDMADYYIDQYIDEAFWYDPVYGYPNYSGSFVPTKAYFKKREAMAIHRLFPNLVKQRKKEQKMLEKDIESKSCAYAKSKGWITYKFTSPARRSVPDRIFISPVGDVVFIEFKQTGKKPTDKQWREIARLQQQGCNVLVVDSVESCKFLIDAW